MKLGAKQLRDVNEEEAVKRAQTLERLPMYFILEDVLDTYNIGGLFRLADALAIEKIYLCGGTETPPNHKIKKASIGTYKVVPWEYKSSVQEALDDIKRQTSNIKHKAKSGKMFNVEGLMFNVQVIAVEQHKTSTDYRKINYTFPVALILGNETTGIKEETLKLATHIAEIPMWGINKSLNVIVSAAIVSYHVVGKISG